ncbi:beta-glucosidase family protein [Amycolatopsis magusensis]|uniref:Beta-glucosidase n=1 Tax=Amycolatopsis magusensis TaxID=882444 RepID=A0ABS4PH48_9PSEU|nr:glycoside hydrolase family 3 C-terminal domain-containing protein [Amycolatopsis magusensis]MBP2178693.1 beta-glucosidase [Amycolatopsis magusensis]
MRITELVPGLDLDTKAALLAGRDVWTLPAVAEIGLGSLVMSDGPVGVRGVHWTADDPSVTLPSPTALAATWDSALAERAGRLLAQEARRKDVHVLLAPTVNLHRTPVGGRHFECYSEDPLLTGTIGAGFVRGVQSGGVAAAVKHFVANDSETDRFTVDVRADERTLRELYLAPFEQIVAEARPWAVMAAYNGVNGSLMTENDRLCNGILRDEWGFDGIVVSDWLAARHTTRGANGGLDVAMPGPKTVFGKRLARAVRAGEVAEETVDAMVARVLLLASRVGALDGFPAPADHSTLDGTELAREIARRSFVLLRNENSVLPLTKPRRIAVLGQAATEARILGGGSATVFPSSVVSPLEGLRAAAPDGVEISHAVGADPRTTLRPALDGFLLETVVRDKDQHVLGRYPLGEGAVSWIGDLPRGLSAKRIGTVAITGTFVPSVSGQHLLSCTGAGDLRFTVGRRTLFDGKHLPDGEDLVTAIMSTKEKRFALDFTAGDAVEVELVYEPPALPEEDEGFAWISFGIGHSAPSASEDELLDEAAALAAGADVAVVVVATTPEVETEGVDRTSLALPGRQDELVARVAAVNPNTVVVVNAGSPVEMPWTDEVAAVLLTWFPGQAGGTALADVVFGNEEPGGRLPTTWPTRMADSPVLRVRPEGGVLPYEEGVFIGYRAWDRSGRTPAYWFGHGLGYTTWTYESATVEPDGVRVRVTNSGDRPGREVVQVYLRSSEEDRPRRWLAGFAVVSAAPGESVEAVIPLPERAFATWTDDGWHVRPGDYPVDIGHALDDIRLTTLTRCWRPGCRAV